MKINQNLVSTLIDLALLWLISRSALVEVPEFNIPLVVAHIQSATVLCGDWSIPLAIWPWRCLLSWLRLRTRPYCAISGPSWDVCMITDCLGSFGPMSSVGLSPISSASWIGSLLVNCLFSDQAFRLNRTFLVWPINQIPCKRVFLFTRRALFFLAGIYSIIVCLCRAYGHVTS